MPYPTKKLGEVVDILDSLRKPVTRRDRLPGPYPYYGATGVQDYVANFIFDEDLVLVGEDGARWNAGDNSAYKISGKSWVNNHAHVLRPHRDILLDDWLVYFLNISDLSGYITGTTVKKLNQAKLRLIQIPLPPIGEQRKIVEKIEKLFAKIDQASLLRAESLTASAALLPSALHQIFTTQQHPYKLENVGMSQTKQKVWEEKFFGEIVEIDTTRNTKKELSFVGMEDIKAHSGNFVGSREPREVRSTTFHFDTHHVLYGKLRPYLNKVFLPDFEGHCTTEFLPLLPKREFLTREWLAVWLRCEDTVNDIMATTTGTRMPRANMNKVKKLKIPLPPVAEQKKIVEYLDSLSAKARALQSLQQETKNDFSALRQSVLSQAFNGQ